MRVLVIDDHAEVRDLVRRALAADGHAVETAGSVAAAHAAMADGAADIIVLDIGLPDGSGMELCRAVRRSGHTAPILLLTARTAVADRVAGLDSGADDFLGKPFAVAELRARVRALARRGPFARGLHACIGAAQLDFAARRALVDTEAVPLTAREWSVLELLALRGGRMVARAEILDIVWGAASDESSASLDVIVRRIRRKLGEAVVRTVRGEGYALGDGAGA